MGLRKSVAWIIAGLCLLANAGHLLAQDPPVLRLSPELTFRTADGQTTRLSSYRGRAVGLVFILPACPKCKDMRVFSRYQQDHGARGFQAVYVVIGSMAEPATAGFLRSHSAGGPEFPGFPVGYASRAEVLAYLGYGDQIMTVPQIVWIDRTGNIRFQTEPNRAEQTTDADWSFVLEPLLADPKAATRPTARSYIGIFADAAANVQGYRIARITPDTPASRAGLEAGDIIVAVNGFGVSSVDSFRDMVADLTPGTPVTFTVLRNNESREVTLTLADPSTRPSARSSATARPVAPAATQASGVINWLGSVEQGGIVDVDSKLLPGIPIDLDIDTTEFTVIEAPSQMNAWKHLVFRCLNRRYTAISIRWTARQP